MTPERKCENCVYWLDYEKDGVCRRYPPTVLILNKALDNGSLLNPD